METIRMTYQEILDYAASHGFDIPADCRRLIRQLSALFLVDEGERLRLYGEIGRAHV